MLKCRFGLPLLLLQSSGELSPALHREYCLFCRIYDVCYFHVYQSQATVLEMLASLKPFCTINISCCYCFCCSMLFHYFVSFINNLSVRSPFFSTQVGKRAGSKSNSTCICRSRWRRWWRFCWYSTFLCRGQSRVTSQSDSGVSRIIIICRSSSFVTYLGQISNVGHVCRLNPGREWREQTSISRRLSIFSILTFANFNWRRTTIKPFFTTETGQSLRYVKCICTLLMCASKRFVAAYYC